MFCKNKIILLIASLETNLFKSIYLIKGYITVRSFVFCMRLKLLLFIYSNFISSYRNKPWISRKNDKAVKVMIKAQILLWRTIEGNRSLRVTVKVRFILFYSDLGPTDPWCNVIWTSIIFISDFSVHIDPGQ